jgi:hypothetical protein
VHLRHICAASPEASTHAEISSSPYLPCISLYLHKASTYAEIAFDQMQMHADLEVSGDVGEMWGRCGGDVGEM